MSISNKEFNDNIVRSYKEKPEKYNKHILQGNWFEENCDYKKHNYKHNTECSQKFVKKPPTALPESVIWDNKLQSEGQGIHPQMFSDTVPNFYQNFSTLHDLSYNHFPKKFYKKRRCITYKMPEYIHSYGNLTDYGLMEEKREEWKYQQIPIRYTMNEINFAIPDGEFYKFNRWTRPTPVKTKHGMVYRLYPSNHPRFSHLNPITWDSWDYQFNINSFTRICN